jgi:hypothetical protein
LGAPEARAQEFRKGFDPRGAWTAGRHGQMQRD